MSQSDLFGARVEPPPEPVRALYDVDCTPSPVAHQIVDHVTRGWLRPVGKDHKGEPYEGDAPRVLDLCAGSGSWARAARLLFPRAEITALEVRADERAFLEHWADRVVIGDVVAVVVQALQVRLRDAAQREAQRLRELLGMLLVDPAPAEPAAAALLDAYDLIVGNPPFSLVDRRKPPKKGEPGKSRLRAFEVLVVAMREFLADDRARLVLYVPAAWWQRGEGIAELAREHGPFRQMNIPLPVSHRGRKRDEAGKGKKKGNSASTDAYAAFVWAREHHGIGRHAIDLPILPAADRRWSEVPGTER